LTLWRDSELATGERNLCGSNGRLLPPSGGMKTVYPSLKSRELEDLQLEVDGSQNGLSSLRYFWAPSCATASSRPCGSDRQILEGVEASSIMAAV
jgi:hypothetical protein